MTSPDFCPLPPTRLVTFRQLRSTPLMVSGRHLCLPRHHRNMVLRSHFAQVSNNDDICP